MEEVLKFLTENPVFFVASIDGDQARVRPFGAFVAKGGKLYFCTSNQKKVFEQIRKRPKVEISSVSQDMRWLRLNGEAVFEGDQPVKQAFFDKLPMLNNIYKGPEDPDFVVFYLKNAAATIQSMDGKVNLSFSF